MAAYLENCMKVCPICKKEFCVSYVPNYVYKLRNTDNSLSLFCSWTCLNKGRDKKKSNRKNRSAYELF